MNADHTDFANSIFPPGDKASSEYFTGSAWINQLAPLNENNSYAVGSVLFEPGARNHWHTHPAGQVLLVTDGEGIYQERGREARALQKGDVVIIPAKIEHWHGASQKSRFSHIAITNSREGVAVEWLEPVSDKDYLEAHQ